MFITFRKQAFKPLLHNNNPERITSCRKPSGTLGSIKISTFCSPITCFNVTKKAIFLAKTSSKNLEGLIYNQYLRLFSHHQHGYRIGTLPPSQKQMQTPPQSHQPLVKSIASPSLEIHQEFIAKQPLHNPEPTLRPDKPRHEALIRQHNPNTIPNHKVGLYKTSLTR